MSVASKINAIFVSRFLTYMYLPAFNLWLLLCPSNLSYDWQMGSIALIESVWELRNAATLLYLATLIGLSLKALMKPGLQVR